MQYIDDFRNARIAKQLAKKITTTVIQNRKYQIMEFCGGHTHALHRYGLLKLLPPQIEMIHGPGCPVCVLAIARIDQAIALSQQPDIIFCSYGDMLRVPGTKQQSLLQAKANGADVRMVYSIDDALQLARKNQQKKIIFFAIGFETTTPPTAVAIKIAAKENLKNFSVFCNHVLTPAAMRAILHTSSEEKPVVVNGFIGPAHVSTVIGYQAYADIARDFQKPIVISGFEPLDLLQSIYQLIELINAANPIVKNQFTRAVTATGNQLAQSYITEVFSLLDQFEWRGLGLIPYSALKIRPEFSSFDAEKLFPLHIEPSEEHRACICGSILRGSAKPFDCKLFATVCTPENPLGACMVSSEGACAAYYTYDRLAYVKQIKTTKA